LRSLRTRPQAASSVSVAASKRAASDKKIVSPPKSKSCNFMIGLMIRCSTLEPFPKNLSQPIVTKGKKPLAQRDISRFMLRLPQFVTKDFQGLTKPQKAPCNIEVTLSGN